MKKDIDTFPETVSAREPLSDGFFLNRNVIKLFGEVCDEMANYAISAMLYLNYIFNIEKVPRSKREINLWINSPGGSVSAGLAIYDTMNYIDCDIRTTCVGMAASMGAFLLSAGTHGKREALLHSTVLIHQPLGGTQGQASDILLYAERPNLKWCTDISYIPTKEGFVYLSVIKDLYDNFVVAYKVGTENNNSLVYETIKAAKREVTAELQLHSDQGFQYTSDGYFKLTKSYHITPSMSSPKTPLDNACAENFFSTLKSEWFHRYTPATKEEARLLLGEYIHFYNYERIQLKNKTDTV